MLSWLICQIANWKLFNKCLIDQIIIKICFFLSVNSIEHQIKNSFMVKIPKACIRKIGWYYLRINSQPNKNEIET